MPEGECEEKAIRECNAPLCVLPAGGMMFRRKVIQVTGGDKHGHRGRRRRARCGAGR
jgi:hypothetical protein